MRIDRPSRTNGTWRFSQLALGFALASATAAQAEVAVLHPTQDATLLESPTGAFANGAGPAIFAGRVNTSTQSLRRAAIAFDVAGAVPAGATIVSVRLHLHLSSTSAGPVAVGVHRLLADWGEGPSVALGGGGAEAADGDVTWIHRFHDDHLWAHPGGDFDPAVRASAIVDQPGPYAWGSTSALVSDVQGWLDLPETNFGWLLIGDEARPQTVKRFESRESPETALRPALEITYLPICEPAPGGLGYWRRVCAAPAGARGPGDGDAVDGDCAARMIGGLLLPPFDPCAAVLADPPLSCEERALRALAVLVLNVCSGRLQTTCDAADDEACLSATVGDRLHEVAALIRAGDCRRAASCAALPE